MKYYAYSDYRKYMHEDSVYSQFMAVDSEVEIELPMVQDYKLREILDAWNGYGGMRWRIRYVNDYWYVYQWGIGTWIWEKLVSHIEREKFHNDLYIATVQAGLIKTTLF